MVDHVPRILVVDDEPDIADMYAELLSDDYDCRVAYSGEEALTAYEPNVDVVLLDRRMPDLTGDEVLEALREMDGECRVAMVTAVDPDFDVIEMGFDDYLVKPVFEEDLEATIQRLLKRSAYRREVQTYFSLVTKRAALEAEKSSSKLEQSDRYRSLLNELEGLESELEGLIDQLTLEDYAVAFRDVQNDST